MEKFPDRYVDGNLLSGSVSDPLIYALYFSRNNSQDKGESQLLDPVAFIQDASNHLGWATDDDEAHGIWHLNDAGTRNDVISGYGTRPDVWFQVGFPGEARTYPVAPLLVLGNLYCSLSEVEPRPIQQFFLPVRTFPLFPGGIRGRMGGLASNYATAWARLPKRTFILEIVARGMRDVDGMSETVARAIEQDFPWLGWQGVRCNSAMTTDYYSRRFILTSWGNPVQGVVTCVNMELTAPDAPWLSLSYFIEFVLEVYSQLGAQEYVSLKLSTGEIVES